MEYLLLWKAISENSPSKFNGLVKNSVCPRIYWDGQNWSNLPIMLFYTALEVSDELFVIDNQNHYWKSVCVCVCVCVCVVQRGDTKVYSTNGFRGEVLCASKY